jgi:hypothetical protein
MRNDGREPVLMEFLGVKVDKVAGSLFIWRSPSSEAFDYACWPLILKVKAGLRRKRENFLILEGYINGSLSRPRRPATVLTPFPG